jgi:RNase P/RNase MRP subunit p30
MSLTKIVNGKEVVLTAEEEAQVKYEWEAFNIKYQNYVANEQYKDLRKSLYPTTEELIVALWEKIIENRPESADALQTLRENVKLSIAKPN